MDLEYSNKDGVSLKDILLVLQNKQKSKKDIQVELKKNCNIDSLLKKLETNNFICKNKIGKNVLYSVVENPASSDNNQIFCDVCKENPYTFVDDLFVNTFNGEVSTVYFRRKDDASVKSIFNKFKHLFDVVNDYVLDQQNTPFYRVFTIDQTKNIVKIYHVDMDRMIRGIHFLFKINDGVKLFSEID